MPVRQRWFRRGHRSNEVAHQARSLKAGRCLRDGRVGSEPDARANENPLAPTLVYGSPGPRIPSRLVKNGKREGAKEKENACRNGARREPRVSCPRSSIGSWEQGRQLAIDLGSERGEWCRSRLWLHVDHDVERRQREARRPSPEDLTNPAFGALSDHRLANLAARRDSQSCRSVVIGMDVKRGESPMALAAHAVTPLKLDTAMHSVRPPKRLCGPEPRIVRR